MGYKTLYEALPFLKNVDKDRQEQFKTYFKSAPSNFRTAVCQYKSDVPLL